MSSHVRLNHPSVSRRHALLQFDGAEWYVSDQASANGVYVDGVKTESAALYQGQELRIGLVPFRVELGYGEDPDLTITGAEMAAPLDQRRPGWLAIFHSHRWTAAAGLLVVFAAVVAAGVLAIAGRRWLSSAAGPGAIAGQDDPRNVTSTAAGRAESSLLFAADVDCEVSLDGARLAIMNHGQTLRHPVGPGEHLVAARAGDGRVFETVVAVGFAGEQKVIKIVFPPAAPAARASPEKREPELPSRASGPASRGPGLVQQSVRAPQPLGLTLALPAGVSPRPYGAFDTRLAATPLSSDLVEGTPVDIAALGEGVLLLYADRLIAQLPGLRVVVSALAGASRVITLTGGTTLLQRQDALVPAASSGSLQPSRLALRPGSEVSAADTDTLIVARQDTGRARFEELTPAGERRSAWEIPGQLRSFSWNGEGFAAVVGSGLWVGRPGKGEISRIDETAAYASASGVAALENGRVLVALADRVMLATRGYRSTVAMLRARLAATGRRVYLLDIATRLVWRVEGFGLLGTRQGDEQHVRKLLADGLASCRPGQPCRQYDEAARLIEGLRVAQ